MQSDFVAFDSLLESLSQYKCGLDVVGARLNGNMAGIRTTYSYSSMMSSKKALLKGRPGSLFENVYLMNMFKTIVLQINDWRVSLQELLDVFEEFQKDSIIESHKQRFEPIQMTPRKDADDNWNYRRADVDFELPIAEMPVPDAHSN